jgi:hypothetical protein
VALAVEEGVDDLVEDATLRPRQGLDALEASGQAVRWGFRGTVRRAVEKLCGRHLERAGDLHELLDGEASYAA